MNENKDQVLLQWIKGGDLKKRDEAFAYLYRTYYPVIQKFVEQNKGTKDDAKDIFQDGLIVLYHQILKGAFKEKSTVETYLYSICRNLWLKKITRSKGTMDLIENHKHIKTDDNILQSLIGTEQEQCIEEVLNELGAECNNILKYFYFDKLSMKKIKDKLQLASEQVAKNKKMKCLKKLRKLVLENSLYLSILKTSKDG